MLTEIGATYLSSMTTIQWQFVLRSPFNSDCSATRTSIRYKLHTANKHPVDNRQQQPKTNNKIITCSLERIRLLYASRTKLFFSRTSRNCIIPMCFALVMRVLFAFVPFVCLCNARHHFIIILRFRRRLFKAVNINYKIHMSIRRRWKTIISLQNATRTINVHPKTKTKEKCICGR